MDVFDIIGPIMVGPSSSHTAGALRIGLVARRILGKQPVRADIGFHGSFATTYKGHGSDRAVVAGLLNFGPADERVVSSLEIASAAEVEITFKKINLADVHPNTITIDAVSEDGREVSIIAHSVGGGNILVTKIDDIDVEYSGRYDTVVINHKDAPGAIALVTKLLADKGINIAGMKVYRSFRGGDAIMLIESDGRLRPGLAKDLEAIPHITRATVIGGLA